MKRLEDRGDWLCVPRIIRKAPAPVPLREGTARSLVVFPAEARTRVEKGISRMEAFDGNTVTSSPFARGHYFQWDRTEVHGRRYVIGGASASRIYFHAGPITNMIRGLVARIRRESTLTTTGRIRVFIGPHLAARLIAKSATLCYPNGKAAPLKTDETTVSSCRARDAIG